MSDSTAVLGIDIGGSSIKGAPVDVERGVLLADCLRIPTPAAAKPQAIAREVAAMAQHFDWTGPIGCAFPAVVENGVTRTAANVDKSWIDTDGRQLLQQSTGCSVTLLNDADAAGLAEMRLGAGRGHSGLVIMLTLGTGIGSALFMKGLLVPNTELGHLVIRGQAAESRASGRARVRHSLSWQAWAELVDEYLCYVEDLLRPELFILGGGVSQNHREFLHLLTTETQVVPAEMRNDAGIVGAALAALPETEPAPAVTSQSLSTAPGPSPS